MDFVWIAIIILAFIFGAVILVGAPYLPTTRKAREDALDLLGLKKEQMLVDLGCGDGTMLIAAAKRGLRAEGFEINPILALIARLRTLRYGNHVKIHLGNFWKADLSNADGVFVFLVGHYMSRLDRLLSSQQRKKSLKLASHGFEIPGKKPAGEQGAIFLYEYRYLARKP